MFALKNLLLISFIVLTSFFSVNGQVIPMEKKGGVYYIPCKVNGLGLKFIFDTGASTVSISSTEALFMLKNGYLKAEDLGDSEYYRIANGDIAEGTKVVLRKIEIGDRVLYNIEASIVHSLEAPLLLGQSVMERLGQFTIEYPTNSLIIGNQNIATNPNGKISKSNDYPSVVIGDQVWMTENLNVDRFRNGDLIPKVQANEEWLNSNFQKQPAWCHYANDLVNGFKNGAIYNGYVIADKRGLCPEGWHVPTKNEWETLDLFLDGWGISGGRLKSKEYWKEGDNGNDRSGFKGYPSGLRDGAGTFDYFGEFTTWWSSTAGELNGAIYWTASLAGSNSLIIKEEGNGMGFSVRCLKD
jgi:clan AA aspartic protease (TIGR02281 family)